MSNANPQKIALAVQIDIVSPLFDTSNTVLVLEIKDGRVIRRHHEPIGYENYSRALRLSRADIQVLICGGISHGLQRAIESQGIQVISNVQGNAEKVLETYLNGTLR